MAKMSLDDLISQLRQMHGGRLRCVLLYGSAAAGREQTTRSDHNVLVLVDSIDGHQLEGLGQTVAAWEEAGNHPPFELTVAEWIRSADIFPMEYADILASHRVLFGALPETAVEVTTADLRRQTEYEAMSKVLRLRQGIMRAGHDTKRQLALLLESHSTLMVIFRGAIRTIGEPTPSDRAELIARVAELAGIDAAPFVRVLRHVRKDGEIARGEAESLLFGILAGMEQLTDWLDSRPA